MRKWLLRVAQLHGKEDLAPFARVEWPRSKPPAHVYLDDRAMTFAGSWPSVEELLAFRPWNSRPA
jgi:hypothetical protein